MLYSCSFCSIDSAGNHEFNCTMNPTARKTITGCVNPFINIHEISHVSIPISLRDDLIKFLEDLIIRNVIIESVPKKLNNDLLERLKGT